MKAKRILSTIIAAMLLTSTVAVSASADTNPVIDPNENVSLTITLLRAKTGDTTADDANSFGHVHAVAGTVQDTDGREVIPNSTFEIYFDADGDGDYEDEEKVSTITTNTQGVAKLQGVDETEVDTVVDDKVYEDQVLGLAQGRYLVKNTVAGDSQSSLVANFEVDLPMTNPDGNGWLYDVNVYPKLSLDTKPSVDKQVKGSNDGDTDYSSSASIDVLGGELAEWKITTTVQDDIDTYKKLLINDTIDLTQLTPVNASNQDFANITENDKLKEAITVKFLDSEGNEVSTTPGYTVSYSKDDDAQKGTIQVNITPDSVTGVLSSLDGVKEITVEFKTQLLKTGEKLPNDVEVYYRNSSWKETVNDNGTPEDPDDDTTEEIDDVVDNTPGDNEPEDEPDATKDPYAYTGKIDVTKIKKGDENTKLAGVEFELYKVTEIGGAEQYNKLDTTATDQNGVFSFEGLENGKYALLETKTIAGYELIGEYIPFYVHEGNFSDVELGIKDSVNDIAYHKDDEVDNDANLVNNFIQNTPSTDLPLTGGMGTTMFALAGMVFVTAGGTFFFKKSKKDEVAE